MKLYMEIEKIKGVIEAILFATGRDVKINEFVSCLEINQNDVVNIIENMRQEFNEQNRGVQIIKVEDGYAMCTKEDYYEYIYPILDKRTKPNLSNAALETLAIIAYNPKITRAEIELIRGVNSDATIYKLLEYNLIEDAGKSDAPGKPTTYRTTEKFLKMFGYTSLEELPTLPKYKMDENQQLIIEDLVVEDKPIENEAPMPEREENDEIKDDKQ